MSNESKKRTFTHKCAVKGTFSIGGRVGICGQSAVCDGRFCAAPLNHLCPHKRKNVQEVT